MGLDLGEEDPDEWETQADGQGLYLIGNIFNSPEEDATSKWLAKWGAKNEQFREPEASRLVGWNSGNEMPVRGRTLIAGQVGRGGLE